MLTFREIKIDEFEICVATFTQIIKETSFFGDQMYKASPRNETIFRSVLARSIQLGIRPFVAEEDNIIKGINLVCDLDGFEYKEWTTFCFGTFVFEEFRNQGIATKLTEYSFQELKKKGVKYTLGQVFNGRQSSDKFINELGFFTIKGVCKKL